MASNQSGTAVKYPVTYSFAALVLLALGLLILLRHLTGTISISK